MKTLKTYSVLFVLFIIGCSSESVPTASIEFQTKDDFLNYLMGGYLNGSEPLYLVDGAGGRLEKLYKALGLSDCYNGIYTVNKGELLIFEKDHRKLAQNELGTLVLSADAPPRLIGSPEDLWDGQCRVFHYNKKEGLQCLDKKKFERWSNPPIHLTLNEIDGKDEYLKFYNGHVIAGHYAIYMDEDARFLCYRKMDKKLEFGTYTYYESEPSYIISVDNPKIMVKSRLEWFPDSMVIDNNRLYLGTITLKKSLPLFHFEVFDIIGDNELVYLKDYYVDVPCGFAVTPAYMLGYDFKTHSQIINVYRNFPFSNNQYLYSYGNNSFKRIPRKILRLIDPAILKNSVQYVDLEKLNAENKTDSGMVSEIIKE